MKTSALLLLFVPAISFCVQCDTSNGLQQIRPGAEWVLTNNDLSTLVWMSTQTVPSAPEIQAAIDACNFSQTPPQLNLTARNDAITNFLNSTSERDKLIRAILLTIIDENNVTRQWITGFKAAVAAAVSLADLKTRVAALPDMPDRTVSQAKAAVQSKISSGQPD